MKKIISSLSILAVVFTSPSVLAAKSAHDSGDKIVDVTNGQEIRGVTTPSDAWGYGKISYLSNKFKLYSGFEGLNDPVGDDFYEGWLVQQSPFKFISTGEAVKGEDGKYYNNFTSDIDYTSYDFYVLTLEPNDGNPAPADHILEGNVTVLSQADLEAKEKTKDHSSEGKDVVIDLTGENFSFSQDTIEVYKGDRVTINFKSTEGFHDWGVDEFDAWTKQVSPGETTSVTFVADKVGSFEFYCSVGNHRDQGMLGWLIVKDREHNTSSDAKTLTETQKALKTSIKSRISKLNLSASRLETVLGNIDKVRDSLPERNLSAATLGVYNDVLDVAEVVIKELISES